MPGNQIPVTQCNVLLFTPHSVSDCYRGVFKNASVILFPPLSVFAIKTHSWPLGFEQQQSGQFGLAVSCVKLCL